jgi:hypothetical protein
MHLACGKSASLRDDTYDDGLGERRVVGLAITLEGQDKPAEARMSDVRPIHKVRNGNFGLALQDK